MLQVHDSAAGWRSFFEETCANEISNFAAQWPEKTGFIQSFEDEQAWEANEYYGKIHPLDMFKEGLLVDFI